VKPFLPAVLLGVGLATATVTPSVAYPVDCAILLCLAGGWPASAECAHARAVFIRRITPWPIEPPLQIWNCPMRASFKRDQRPLEQLFKVAIGDGKRSSAISIPDPSMGPLSVSAQADVDISSPAFDFVRSIRVFEINYQQRSNSDGDCITSEAVSMGSYGQQGDYRRQQSRISAVPAASFLAVPPFCGSYLHRSVFVEWRDYQGSYGHEEVHY
jgi:hypothetical protein